MTGGGLRLRAPFEERLRDSYGRPLWGIGFVTRCLYQLTNQPRRKGEKVRDEVW
jgi:hypothetical protein